MTNLASSDAGRQDELSLARGSSGAARGVTASGLLAVAVDRADGVWVAPDAIDATGSLRTREAQTFTENP